MGYDTLLCFVTADLISAMAAAARWMTGVAAATKLDQKQALAAAP